MARRLKRRSRKHRRKALFPPCLLLQYHMAQRSAGRFSAVSNGHCHAGGAHGGIRYVVEFWQSKAGAGNANFPRSPVGHSMAPSRTGCKSLICNLSYSPNTFKSYFNFSQRTEHLHTRFDRAPPYYIRY